MYTRVNKSVFVLPTMAVGVDEFGGFKTLEEAILVADKARLSLLCEFARSN